MVNAEELANEISQPTIICGELSAEERQIISRKWKKALLTSPAQSMRRPSNLAELAWKRWKNNDVDDPAVLAPIYLHLQRMAVNLEFDSREGDILIRPMQVEDIPQVQEIDSISFPTPWPKNSFLFELKDNQSSLSWVAEIEEAGGKKTICRYVGFMVDSG